MTGAFERFFATHDFLVTPISPGLAPFREDKSSKIREALLQLNTHVSVAGLPALSVPVSLPRNLSTGVQIVFPHRESPTIAWVLNRCSEI